MHTAPLGELSPGQLEQLIVNLAVNARDAMPGGGRLSLSTANRELDEERASEVGLAAAGRYVELSIEDTGTGIDGAILGNIFEPFFTTKDATIGSGLGLSLVKETIESFGGTVTCHSAPGRGTEFTLDLPLS